MTAPRVHCKSNQRKLSDEQIERIKSRYCNGESSTLLAKAHNVSTTTIARHLRRAGVLREKKSKSSSVYSVVEFIKRCKSILWRQDGVEKKTYEQWQNRVNDLQENAGYNKFQAAVQAGKEFPCLHRLFREYNLSRHDPNPESHPTVQTCGKPGISKDMVVNRGNKQSHQENLEWAIEMAGEFMRSGEDPNVCPNNSAWYLYVLAKEDPKEFVGKFTQIAAKTTDKDAEKKESIKLGNKALNEISSMLDASENGGDNTND